MQKEIANKIKQEIFFHELFTAIGEDPKREGLKDTPKRVLNMWKEIFNGYNTNIEEIITTFENNNYDEIIILKNIELYSMCEHHILPFIGKAHIAYIPDKKIIGVSKLARIVDAFSKRLQIQERLTKQISGAIKLYLEPLGVAVVIEAEHLCMRMRGVSKQNSVMITSCLEGVFRDDQKAREEFFNLIRK